jgi:hypothetical protein
MSVFSMLFLLPPETTPIFTFPDWLLGVVLQTQWGCVLLCILRETGGIWQHQKPLHQTSCCIVYNFFYN